MNANEEKNIARAALIEGEAYKIRTPLLIGQYQFFRRQSIPIIPSAVMANYVMERQFDIDTNRLIDPDTKQKHILALYELVQERLNDPNVSAFIARTLAKSDIPPGTAPPQLSGLGEIAIDAFRELEERLD